MSQSRFPLCQRHDYATRRYMEAPYNTQHAVKEITTFLGMLSDYYKKDKEEGLKFE